MFFGELQVNCCRWHPMETNVLASGSQDMVKMWDLRQKDKTLTFRYRDKSRCVRFSRFEEHRFAVVPQPYFFRNNVSPATRCFFKNCRKMKN